MWVGGEGQGAGRGTGGGAPPQPIIEAVRHISPGIQHMPAHHTHHHHQSLYNIDVDMGDLIPHQPPRPPYKQAPHPHSGAPRGPAPAARESGSALAQQAQELQAEPARGAEGAQGDWDRD